MAKVPYISVGNHVDFANPLGSALERADRRQHNKDTLALQREQQELNEQRHLLNIRKDDRDQLIHDRQVEFDKVMGDLQLNPTAAHMGGNYQREMNDALAEIGALEKDYKNNLDILNRQRGYFTKDGTITESGKKALQEHTNRLTTEGRLLPGVAADQAMADLRKVALDANNSDYEKRQLKYINARKQAFDYAKSQAPTNMSIEEYVAMAQKQLDGQGYDRAYSQEALVNLTNRAKAAGLRSRSDIISEARGELKGRHDRKVKQAELLNNYYKLQSKRGSTTSSVSGQKSFYATNKAFEEFLETLDQWGTDEKDDARSLARSIAKDPEIMAAGVTEKHIKEAMMVSMYDGIWSDWGIGKGVHKDADLKKELIASAISLADGAKKAGGTGNYVDRKDFLVGNYTNPLDSTIMANRFSKYMPKVRDSYRASAVQTLNNLLGRPQPFNPQVMASGARDTSYPDSPEALMTILRDGIQKGGFDRSNLVTPKAPVVGFSNTPEMSRLRDNDNANALQGIFNSISSFNKNLLDRNSRITDQAAAELGDEIAAYEQLMNRPQPPAGPSFAERRMAVNDRVTQEALAELNRVKAEDKRLMERLSRPKLTPEAQFNEDLRILIEEQGLSREDAIRILNARKYGFPGY